jgi:[acyl-carrier-protein] S-malonyltransferase
MLSRIVAAWPAAASIVRDASRILGRDLAGHYGGNGHGFETNRDIQVGVFLVSHLHLKALQAAGVQGDYSLGLSLGEYNHLVHIGALAFESALRLVDARGKVYDRGPPGMMASVFPLELEQLGPIVEQARAVGAIEIANYNSPTQHVVAGEKRAVEVVMRRLDEEFCIEATVIEHNIPMHTPGFRPVAAQLRPHLDQAAWQRPTRPYLPNVTAELTAQPAPALIVSMLERHVYSPVYWRDSIDLLVRRLPAAVFIEVGPRSVLYNLLQKRWHSVQKYRTDMTDDIAENLRMIGKETTSPAA